MTKRSAAVVVLVLAVCGTDTLASAQITTGTLSGIVRDTQGAVVPGATISLISETQGTRIGPLTTNAEGIYVFPNLAGDTYTVEATLPGFKTLVRRAVEVSGGDRVALPTLVLEPGGLSEQVEVKAESPIIQAASGERSFSVQASQLASL